MVCCLNRVFILIRHINTDAAVQNDLDEGKIGSNCSYSENSMGTVGVAHPQSTEALEYIVILFVWEKKLYLRKHVMNNSGFFHQITFLIVGVIHLWWWWCFLSLVAAFMEDWMSFNTFAWTSHKFIGTLTCSTGLWGDISVDDGKECFVSWAEKKTGERPFLLSFF